MIIINKRNLFFLISVWLLSTLLSAQNVTISTPHTQLLLSVPNRNNCITAHAPPMRISEAFVKQHAEEMLIPSMEWGIHAKRHCLSAMPTAT